MSDLKANPPTGDPAARVRAALEALGLLGEVVYFEQSTRTAVLAAEAIGCDLGQIAKSLLFMVDGRPVLALIAGDRKGDGKAIAREAGGRKASMADAETVQAVTGYAIGGVSPFDLPPDLPVLVDESLARFETVCPAAGTSASMVRVPFALLVEVTRGRVAPICQEIA